MSNNLIGGDININQLNLIKNKQLYIKNHIQDIPLKKTKSLILKLNIPTTQSSSKKICDNICIKLFKEYFSNVKYIERKHIRKNSEQLSIDKKITYTKARQRILLHLKKKYFKKFIKIYKENSVNQIEKIKSNKDMIKLNKNDKQHVIKDNYKKKIRDIIFLLNDSKINYLLNSNEVSLIYKDQLKLDKFNNFSKTVNINKIVLNNLYNTNKLSKDIFNTYIKYNISLQNTLNIFFVKGIKEKKLTHGKVEMKKFITNYNNSKKRYIYIYFEESKNNINNILLIDTKLNKIYNYTLKKIKEFEKLIQIYLSKIFKDYIFINININNNTNLLLHLIINILNDDIDINTELKKIKSNKLFIKLLMYKLKNI